MDFLEKIQEHMDGEFNTEEIKQAVFEEVEESANKILEEEINRTGYSQVVEGEFISVDPTPSYHRGYPQQLIHDAIDNITPPTPKRQTKNSAKKKTKRKSSAKSRKRNRK